MKIVITDKDLVSHTFHVHGEVRDDLMAGKTVNIRLGGIRGDCIDLFEVELEKNEPKAES